MIPLIWVGVVVGFGLLATGCNEEKKPVEKKPESESTGPFPQKKLPSAPQQEPRPSADISYSKSDILGGAEVPFEKQQAAFYDYVQSTYYLNGSYEGVLTKEEKQFVDSKGIKIGTSEKISWGMSYARRSFFQGIDPTKNLFGGCRAQTKAFQVTDKTYGTAWAIGSAHNCPDQFDTFFTPIELEIAAHPDQWVLFLEVGTDVFNTMEAVYFNRLNERLGIPIYSPLFRMEHEEVLRTFNKRYHRNREDVAFNLTLMNVYRSRDHKIEGLFEGDKIANIDSLLRNKDVLSMVQENATLFKVDEKTILKRLKTYLTAIKNLKDVENDIVSFMNQYVEIANELAPPYIAEILKNNPGKKALFVVGEKHLPAIQKTYKNSANWVQIFP